MNTKAYIAVKAALWIIWAITAALLLVTIFMEATSGHVAFILYGILILLLLVALYYIEGMELAVADLNNKDSLILGPSIRRVIDEIHDRHEFFISQRQLLSVAIISFIAIVMERGIEEVYIPLFGYTNYWIVTILVNFVFINLTVLWFCQISPKRLAARNSELFFDRGKTVWPLVKTIGILKIDSPSDEITSFSAYIMGVSPQVLPPSRATLYEVATKVMGVSIDRTRTEIVLSGDGSAIINRTYLLLYAHGYHGTIHGHLSFGNVGYEIDLSQISINVLGAVALKPVEDMRKYHKYLDNSFDGRSFIFDRVGSLISFDRDSARLVGGFGKELEITDVLGSINYHISKSHGKERNAVTWNIGLTKELPENFWPPSSPDDPGGGARIKKFVAILYSVQATAQEKAFNPPGEGDYWDENFIPAPARRVDFNVRSKDPRYDIKMKSPIVTSPHLNSRLKEENDRCEISFVDTGSINYPMPGCVVRFPWEMIELSK